MGWSCQAPHRRTPPPVVRARYEYTPTRPRRTSFIVRAQRAVDAGVCATGLVQYRSVVVAWWYRTRVRAHRHYAASIPVCANLDRRGAGGGASERARARARGRWSERGRHPGPGPVLHGGRSASVSARRTAGDLPSSRCRFTRGRATCSPEISRHGRCCFGTGWSVRRLSAAACWHDVESLRCVRRATSD